MGTINGQRIRELRLARGLTLDQMSEKIEMSIANLSKVERNQRGMSTESLNNVSLFFNVTTDYLMGKVDDSEMTIQTKIRIEKETEGLYELLESLTMKERQSVLTHAKTYIKFKHPEKYSISQLK